MADTLKRDVHLIAQDIEYGLTFDGNKEKYCKMLMKLRECITETDFSNLNYLREISERDLTRARHIFRHYHYTKCCSRLLKSLTVDVIPFLTNENLVTVEEIFRHGPSAEAFMLLSSMITDSKMGFQLHKCVSLMENLLRDDKLTEILWAQLVLSNDKPVYAQSIDCHVADQLITAIVSLPQTVTNRLQRETSEIFYPQSYIPLLCTSILQTLQRARDCLVSSSKCSLEFVSKVFGRLALRGYSDTVWELLLPYLYDHVQSDIVWSQVCETVVTNMPSRCMETSISSLLRYLPWYGLVGKFLGDSVVKNSTVQNLLCTKLLFHCHSSQVSVLQNIIGHLASSDTRRHLFIKVFRSLLDIWGDSSSVRHTSYEQHHYISQALLICTGHVSDSDKEACKQEFVHLLMPGVSCHIGHTDPRMRKLGMVVAETLTKTLDPTGPKLDFQYELDADVKGLLSLTIKSPQPSMEELNRLFKKTVTLDAPSPSETSEHFQPHTTQTASENKDSDLDSDDDLEPYDMSHDVTSSKVKPPRYVRDCMEGLITSDDPDKVQVCLQEAETLIRKKPDGLQEVAAEFSKILLHLTEFTTFPDLLPQRRFSTMVALTVCCPVEVANFLTEEFYERNYNMRQRLDMLEVLAAAAQELSEPNSGKDTMSIHSVEEMKPDGEPQSWREIVEKRIENKTRRFARGHSQPLTKPVVNRFAAVAGYFFYPLMKNFDRKENTFDLLKDDTLILGRLVYTLGVILYCAVNTHAARHMAVTFLEFTWALRFHLDVFVRKAVLFGTSMVVLVMPGFSLVSELHTELTEMKIWLDEVSEKDPETECRKMAVQCILLLENAIKQEFK